MSNIQDKIVNLPAPLLTFIKQHDLDIRNFISDQLEHVQRFFRVPIHWQNVLTIDKLAVDLHVSTSEIQPITTLPGFYALPRTVKLAQSILYQEGKIFGMDITSGIAVYALELSPTDQVLDLCCAPGAKLCLIAEQLANTSPSSTKGIGTVTGVDISSHRIATCRSLLRKYPAPGLPRVRLFKADGTTFSVYAPSRVGPHWTRPNLEQILATNQTANTKSTTILKPFHAPKTLRHDPQLVHPALLYDKVLVDAECTHDGSLAHVQKHQDKDWSELEDAFLAPNRLDSIDQLQRDLLVNGWRLLRPGGLLVYATCSLTPLQNEQVIAWFLRAGPGAHGQAILEPAINPTPYPTVPARQPANTTFPYQLTDKERECLLRFEPWYSSTSGLFIARLRKIQS